ncbi:hypothetical protein WG66_016232 [Moniliophthora roreri]|nr:hypothetical protein WG66_016232 [Moniliophthora roreri]
MDITNKALKSFGRYHLFKKGMSTFNAPQEVCAFNALIHWLYAPLSLNGYCQTIAALIHPSYRFPSTNLISYIDQFNDRMYLLMDSTLCTMFLVPRGRRRYLMRKEGVAIRMIVQPRGVFNEKEDRSKEGSDDHKEQRDDNSNDDDDCYGVVGLPKHHHHAKEEQGRGSLE